MNNNPDSKEQEDFNLAEETQAFYPDAASAVGITVLTIGLLIIIWLIVTAM